MKPVPTGIMIVIFLNIIIFIAITIIMLIIYIYVCMCIHIYIYIEIERERYLGHHLRLPRDGPRLRAARRVLHRGRRGVGPGTLNPVGA